jgi:hypothetical protein
MKNVLLKSFTLYIQFSGHAQARHTIQLPFYPKAWRKHPAYDGAFQNAIACAALHAGLSTDVKPSCYSLIAA